MRRYVFDQIAILVICAALLVNSCLILSKGEGNWFDALICCVCALLCISYFVTLYKKIGALTQGEQVLKSSFTIDALPKEIVLDEVAFPCNIWLFPSQSLDWYYGTISITARFGSSEETRVINLRKASSFQLKVPSFLPVSDAGKIIEFWPKAFGTNREPVKIPFPEIGYCVGAVRMMLALHQVARQPDATQLVITIVIRSESRSLGSVDQ